MSPDYVPDKPAWFAERDYAWVHELDTAGWVWALWVRGVCRLNLDRLETNKEFDPNEFWETFLSLTEGPTPFSPPAVVAVEELDPETLHPERIEELSQIPEQAFLSVDLYAPDDVIIESVRAWLLEKRKQFPPFPSRSNKRQPKKVLINDETFERWKRQHILELFDVLFWKRLFHRRESNSAIVGWIPEIESKQSDPVEVFDHARDTLNDALDSLGALGQYAAHIRKKSPP